MSGIQALVGSSGLRRQARASETYVQEVLRAQKEAGVTKLTKEQRKTVLSKMLSGENGVQKVGVAMVGPVQVHLRYEGLSRGVLMEDPATPGVPQEYEVFDQRAQAYMLHGSEGEVKITPFEGKRVPLGYFRIAAFPEVKVEDLYYLKTDIVERAQDESKQSIMKQEDSRLVLLLEAAVQRMSTNDPYGNSHTVLASGQLTPSVFWDAVSISDQLELQSGNLLMNLNDFRDIYRWGVDDVGWKFKDDIIAGQQVTKFGEFTVGRSIVIPPKTTYLTPDPEFLGVLPILYSLIVEEDNTVERFKVGWVMHEMISMLILNDRGIVKIRKA